MFVIYDDEHLHGAFVGFFLSPWVAITVFHDEIFTIPVQTGAPFPVVKARSSTGELMTFTVFAYSDEPLDFVVLIKDGPTYSTAFFPLPSPTDNIIKDAWGLKGAIVTMGLSDFAATGKVAQIVPRVHNIAINFVEGDNAHVAFSGPTLFCGDSGSVLSMRSGVIVTGVQALGMHLAAIHPDPDVEMLTPSAMIAPSFPSWAISCQNTPSAERPETSDQRAMTSSRDSMPGSFCARVAAWYGLSNE